MCREICAFLQTRNQGNKHSSFFLFAQECKTYMNQLALETPNICVLRAKGITVCVISKKLCDRRIGSTVFTRKKVIGESSHWLINKRLEEMTAYVWTGYKNGKEISTLENIPMISWWTILLLIKRRFLFEFLSSGNLSFSDSAQFDFLIQCMSSKGDQVGLNAVRDQTLSSVRYSYLATVR